VVLGTEELELHKLVLFRERWKELLVDSSDIQVLRNKIAEFEKSRKGGGHVGFAAPRENAAKEKGHKGGPKAKNATLAARRQSMAVPATGIATFAALGVPLGLLAFNSSEDNPQEQTPLGFALSKELECVLAVIRDILIGPKNLLSKYICMQASSIREYYEIWRSQMEQEVVQLEKDFVFQETNRIRQMLYEHEQRVTRAQKEYRKKVLQLQVEKQTLRKKVIDRNAEVGNLSERWNSLVLKTEEFFHSAIDRLGVELGLLTSGKISYYSDVTRIEHQVALICKEVETHSGQVLNPMALKLRGEIATFDTEIDDAGVWSSLGVVPSYLHSNIVDYRTSFRDGASKLSKVRGRIDEIVKTIGIEASHAKVELAHAAKITSGIVKLKNRVRVDLFKDAEKHQIFIQQIDSLITSMDREGEYNNEESRLDYLVQFCKEANDAISLFRTRWFTLQKKSMPRLPPTNFVQFSAFLHNTPGNAPKSAGKSSKSHTKDAPKQDSSNLHAPSTALAFHESLVHRMDIEFNEIESYQLIKRVWYQVKSWVMMDALSAMALYQASRIEMQKILHDHVTRCEADALQILSTTIPNRIHTKYLDAVDFFQRSFKVQWKSILAEFESQTMIIVQEDCKNRRIPWDQKLLTWSRQSRSSKLASENSVLLNGWKQSIAIENTTWHQSTIAQLMARMRNDFQKLQSDQEIKLLYLSNLFSQLTFFCAKAVLPPQDDEARDAVPLESIIPSLEPLLSRSQLHPAVFPSSNLVKYMINGSSGILEGIESGKNSAWAHLEAVENRIYEELKQWELGWNRALELIKMEESIA
jgi:hypothetical protein